MEAGEKEESIGVKKGTGPIFSPSCQLPWPLHTDVIYLHFNGALEVDYFGSLLEAHPFIYILWNNLCIWIINILLSDGRRVNDFLTHEGSDVRSFNGGLHEMLHADFCGQDIVMNMAQSP